MNPIRIEQEMESRYALRLPTELYEWVQKEAKSQYRSVNSLIASLLQKEKDKKERGKEFIDA